MIFDKIPVSWQEKGTMEVWEKRTMCTKCHKTFGVYSNIEVCPRCGTILHEIVKRNPWLGDKLVATEFFTECVAKRALFGWKVKEE